MSERSKVLVIIGPTASGKSDLAVKLAKKFNGEIISADSRQVYKRLNIGTGKVTKKEMGGIRHHLLNVVDPGKQFSVSEYKKLAENSLAIIVRKNKLPIVVGGTGFYIDAITGKVNFPDVPPNKLLRKKLDKLSVEKLFSMLKKKDLKRARTIDRHNKVRLVRALEIIDALGKVPSILVFSRTPEYKFVYIGLKPDNLDERIYKRLVRRLPGIIREVKKLYTQGLSWKRMHELGLEYRYVAMYLQDKLDKPNMVNKLYKAIRQYSKRQRLWFKRNKKIRWFRPTETTLIGRYVKQFLR